MSIEIVPEIPEKNEPIEAPKPWTSRSTQSSGPAIRNAVGTWLSSHSLLMTTFLLACVAVFHFASKNSSEAARGKFHKALAFASRTAKKSPSANDTQTSSEIARRQIRTVHHSHESTAFSYLKMGKLTDREIENFFSKLSQENAPTLEDNFVLRLPFNYLFESNGVLAEEGKRNVKAMADHLRKLPYDLVFQVHDDDHVPKIFTLVKYLTTDAKLPASRFGISVRPEKNGVTNMMDFILLAQK